MTIIRERDYIGMILPLIIKKNGDIVSKLSFINNKAEININENDEIYIKQGWYSRKLKINKEDTQGRVMFITPPKLTILLVLALLSLVPHHYIQADDMGIFFWLTMIFPILLLVNGLYYFTLGKNKYFDIKIA